VQYGGITGGLSKIVRDEGIKGLYRGLSPTLFALLPNWAVYFTVYEKLKIAIGTRFPPEKAQSAGVHMAAAAGAGAATMMITNPIWVVKTRIQTQNMGVKMGANGTTAMYKGTIDALVRIGREEGLAGLYSGFLPSLLGVMHVVIQFPLYEQMKQSFAKAHNNEMDKLTPAELIVASAVSKMAASTATYPHEVIRSHMHVAGSGAGFTEFANTCKAVFREEGARGFYRGCLTNLIRTTPAAAATFTSFEVINRKLRAWADTPSFTEREAVQRAVVEARKKEKRERLMATKKVAVVGGGEVGGEPLLPPELPFARAADATRFAALSDIGRDSYKDNNKTGK